MPCELCKLERRSKWHYEDEDFVIIECDTCHIPMVVLRKHTMEMSQRIFRKVEKVSKELFGENIKFRTNQRKISDHLHWHIIC